VNRKERTNSIQHNTWTRKGRKWQEGKRWEGAKWGKEERERTNLIQQEVNERSLHCAIEEHNLHILWPHKKVFPCHNYFLFVTL
jgi:hypothetical protein